MKVYTTFQLSENMHETPEGYLVCVGVPIARTGEMEYVKDEIPLDAGDDGKIVVSRDEKEVFRPQTMASFEGKSFTIYHPDEFLNPDNWAQLSKGLVRNVRRGQGDDKTDLLADILVTDRKAIDLVKSGLREVSCGYDAEYIQDGHGRGIQKNIIGNHVALVDQGRAGAAYAINDHKGKEPGMSVKDKIKAIFAKAEAEALTVATQDAEPAPAEKTKGYSLDDVMKSIQDMGEKVNGFVVNQKAGDATTQPTPAVPATVTAKDDEPAPTSTGPSMEERMAKLEAMVAKLAGAGMSADDEPDVLTDDADPDDDDEFEDEKGCDEDPDDDDDKKTGDSLSRIEILAPGMKYQGKDAKARALKVCYATADGKAVIDQFTGGKAPDLKNQKTVDALFVGASEVLKSTRTDQLSRAQSRTVDFGSIFSQPKGALSPEELNKKNEEFYKSKMQH